MFTAEQEKEIIALCQEVLDDEEADIDAKPHAADIIEILRYPVDWSQFYEMHENVLLLAGYEAGDYERLEQIFEEVHGSPLIDDC